MTFKQKALITVVVGILLGFLYASIVTRILNSTLITGGQ